MPNCRFRIRFKLPYGDYINHDEAEFQIHLSDGNCATLKAFGKAKTIKESNQLVLCSGTYITPQDAESAGARAKYSLMAAATKLGMGFDLGRDKAAGGFSSYVKNKVLSESGVHILDDVHGLCVFDDSSPTQFAYVGSPTLRRGNPVDSFTNAFTGLYAKNIKLNDKETLAFELYGMSHFEISARARFLILVMAIEAMLEPKTRNSDALKLVSELLEITKKAELNDKERQSLIGSLQWLLKESISKTGRDLVERYLGDKEYAERKAKDFFSYCYTIRSQLVHHGKLEDQSLKLDIIRLELEKMVAELLFAKIDVTDV